jgi:diadenosine tetraphosphatase ApaH/serine/threonine PP2A family protein phosphatase
VINRSRALTDIIIRGNHDKACAGVTDAEDFNALAKLATLWTRQELTQDNADFLRKLPPGPRLMEGFELVHGSETDEDEYIVGPAQALPALRTVTVQLVFFGHTHHQGGFALHPGGRLESIQCFSESDGQNLVLPVENSVRYLINPGSVGQPRDGDWRAAFAIYDHDERTVEYYRTAYDRPTTQRKMEKAKLPEPLIRRLDYGR